MSFTTEIKNEICSNEYSRLENIAMLSGFLRNNFEVLEEKIVQDETMSSLHPSSVNTFRIVTYKKPSGEIVVHLPFIKIGQKGSFVDNGGAGGILALIDEKTGVIITDGKDELNNIYKKHPDTKIKLKGFQIPMWNEIKELAKIASIIKVICVQQPNALEGILASIEEQDPQLMELIKQNEDAFRTLLNQPVTNQDIKNFQDFQDNSQGGGYEERRNPPGTIELTKEEFEAVKRLREFGNFTDAEIVQAYFACDKNEELAVNLLFENKMNEDNGEINVNIVDDTNPQTNAQIQNPQLPTQLDMNQIGNLFSVLGQVLHGQSQQGQNQPQQPPKDDKKDEEKKDEGDKK